MNTTEYYSRGSAPLSWPKRPPWVPGSSTAAVGWAEIATPCHCT